MEYLEAIDKVREKIKGILKDVKPENYVEEIENYEQILLRIAEIVNGVLKEIFNNKKEECYLSITPAIYSYILNKPVFSKTPAWGISNNLTVEKLNKNYENLRKNYYDILAGNRNHFSLFELIFKTHGKEENRRFDPPVMVLVNKNDCNETEECKRCVNKACSECKTDKYLYVNVTSIVEWITNNVINEEGEISPKNLPDYNEIRKLFNDDIVNAFDCWICKEKEEIENILQEKLNREWDDVFFHTVMSTFVLYAFMQDSWDYVYHIPVSFPGLTIGGFIIRWKGASITKNEGIFLKTLASEALSFPVLIEKREKIRQHAVKSAVSAIIARNHSHHVHSHITPRTSVKKIRKKLDKKIVNDNEELNNNVFDIIHRLKTRLDEYIQQKADFMAEIATEPLISAKTLSFFQEIIIPFVTNTLLMDNLCANKSISYPENKVYGNRLKIFVTFKNIPLDATFSCGEHNENKLSAYPYHDACNTCNREIKFQGIKGRDFDIAVPGPLGEYAFYSFLENFIRNAAKHNRKQFENDINENLEIHIEVSEIETKDIEDEDNRNFFKKEDKDTFYKVEIWDNVTKPDKHIQGKKLVECLKEKIRKPIIEEDGSLRRKAWGIAEMKIMATLLKGSANFLRLHENLSAKRSKKRNEEGNKFRLVYAFKIMRPKKVALLCNIKEIKEDRHNGVWQFTSIDEYKKHIQQGESVASFEFAVIDKKLAEEFRNKKEKDKKKIWALLPFRVLIEGNNDDVVPGAVEINDEFVEKFKALSAEGILFSVWEKWIGHVTKDNPYSMVIYLGRSENESWAKFADKYNKNRDKNIALHILSKNSEKLPSNDNNRFLMYDRHFDALENKPNFKPKTVFHEIIDKNSSDFIHIFSHSNEEIFYGLVEASLLNVLIIDERAAEMADEDIMGEGEASNADCFYGGRSRLHAFRRGKVFICTHIKKGGDTIPLHLSIKDKYPRITVELKKGEVPSLSWKEDEEDKQREGDGPTIPDIVIIHQGIMKDILKETDLSAFIDGLRKHIPYVAIVSGRGIPPDLPQTEKFVPFSLLEKWVMKERLSKYSLVKFLMPLKRRRVV